MQPTFPIDQVYSYLPKINPQRLKGEAQTDVVIIGGGMAGISAAQKFKDKGCSVIFSVYP